MLLNTVVVTAFAENCYIVGDPISKEIIVVDPGGQVDLIAMEMKNLGGVLKYILCTHGHMDHTGGVATLIKDSGAQFGIHESDVDMMSKTPATYTNRLIPDYVQPPFPDILLKDGDLFQVGNVKLEVITTPGHTMGSLCLLGNNYLLAGDTLFQGSVGRTDFPGSSWDALFSSIRSRLFQLDDDITVLPGHGPHTSIGQEKLYNPFVGLQKES